MANICAMIANTIPRKSHKAFSYKDFMPTKVIQRKEPVPWERMLEMVKMLNTGLGGEVNG